MTDESGQMAVDIEQMRRELARDTRKFTLQLIAGLVTAFAAGYGGWTLHLRLAGRI